VEAAGDKKASDIILLDASKLLALADYFVICSGESTKQIGAIAEEVSKRLKHAGAKVLHEEGNPDSGWIILDYGDLIVHIFAPEERKFYQLEDLWDKAETVIRIQ
jgi:ribosome-associated protein